MAKYLIYACEMQYNGLHGMNDWNVYDCQTYEEACEIGHELSYDVITSYGCIEDAFEEEVMERLREEGITAEHQDYDDLYDEWLEELIEEDINYSVYQVQEDIDYDALIQSGKDWDEIRDMYSIDME